MRRVVTIALALAASGAVAADAPVVRLVGSPTVAQAFQVAAPGIKRQLGVDLRFDPQSTTSAAINSLGVGSADLAVITRPLTPEDRSDFPARRFFEVEFGIQALVPIIARETYDAGIKSISRKELASIYENVIRNWKELGGPDQEIKFFNPERGRGVWELFATYVYGDIRKAPLGKKWEGVLTNQDARDSVEFNSGSISIAPPKWADAKRVFALPLREESGVIEPTVENFRSRKWPITRPLVLVAGDKPTGAIRHVMTFMLGPKGREALEKAEFISLPEAEGKVGEP